VITFAFGVLSAVPVISGFYAEVINGLETRAELKGRISEIVGGLRRDLPQGESRRGLRVWDRLDGLTDELERSFLDVGEVWGSMRHRLEGLRLVVDAFAGENEEQSGGF
jgi:hypothetical protein